MFARTELFFIFWQAHGERKWMKRMGLKYITGHDGKFMLEPIELLEGDEFPNPDYSVRCCFRPVGGPVVGIRPHISEFKISSVGTDG